MIDEEIQKLNIEDAAGLRRDPVSFFEKNPTDSCLIKINKTADFNRNQLFFCQV